MSFHILKEVKIRKDRICTGCIAKVLKGTEMLKMVGRQYDFYSVYVCKECKDFMGAHPDYFEDGWSEGEIGEAREEEERYCGASEGDRFCDR